MSHLVERADHSHAKVSLVQRRWSASMRLPLELVVEVGNRVGAPPASGFIVLCAHPPVSAWINQENLQQGREDSMQEIS